MCTTLPWKILRFFLFTGNSKTAGGREGGWEEAIYSAIVSGRSSEMGLPTGTECWSIKSARQGWWYSHTRSSRQFSQSRPASGFKLSGKLISFFRLTLDMIWYLECLCCSYYTTLNKLCKVHSTEYSSSHVHNTEILFVHVCALHYPERFWDSSSFQETPTSQAKQVEKKQEPSTANQGHQSVTSPLVSLLQIYSWDELNKILGERNLIKRRDFLNILYLSRKLQKFRGRKIQAQLVALHVNWRLMDMSALRIIKTTKLVQPHLWVPSAP